MFSPFAEHIGIYGAGVAVTGLVGDVRIGTSKALMEQCEQAYAAMLRTHKVEQALNRIFYTFRSRRDPIICVLIPPPIFRDLSDSVRFFFSPSFLLIK